MLGSPTAITFKFVCSIFTSLWFFCLSVNFKLASSLRLWKIFFLLLLIYMAHVADFETWRNLYVEFFLQMICVRENNTYQLLQVLRQLKIFMTWRIKMFLLKKFELTKCHLLKKRTRMPVWQKNNLWCEKTKRTTWKTRRPKQYETKKTQKRKRNKTQKNADCGFTGRFAKRFSGERPDPLGFELTFLSEFKRVCLAGAWPRSFAPRLYSQAPAKVPIVMEWLFKQILNSIQ